MKNSLGTITLLYMNSLIENIYDACTCCYDNTKPLTYIQKKEYIKKRVNAGHVSVLEHGRLCVYFKNIVGYKDELIELTTMEPSTDLTFESIINANGSTDLFIIGNMRFFKYFVNNISPDMYEDNIFVRHIVRLLFVNTPRELYGEEVNKYGFINEKDFCDVEPFIPNHMLECPREGLHYCSVRDKALAMPTTNKDIHKSITLGIDNDGLDSLMLSDIPLYIVHKIIPVTVVFRNPSRACTHEIVRHRNAITQESQRYVSAENATFTVPVPDYDKDRKYNISLFGNTVSVTLDDLATELLKVYPQLMNQGLKKEEARGYLPHNVNCKRLYMTFSLEQIFRFIHLRTDPHAQYEIRQYANTIKDVIESITGLNSELVYANGLRL